MTFEMTRIKQRLADLEKNQDKLLKLIFEAKFNNGSIANSNKYDYRKKYW